MTADAPDTATENVPQTAPVGQFSDAKRARMIETVQRDAPSKEKLFRRAYAGNASPLEAIKAHCLQCVGLSEAAVRSCSNPACPLWFYRPYMKPTG